MKKAIIIIVVLVLLGIVAVKFGNRNASAPASNTPGEEQTVSAPVSETTKVNDKLTSYKNEELGFSVKFPSTWEPGATDSGIVFVIPTEKTGLNTVRKPEAKILVTSGKCAFPPVTTIKERSTLKSGDLTFNMISMSNSVQGTNYFDRMYSLQRDSICYILSFSSINVNPTTKGYKGSEATQVTNNNKALVDSADAAFTAMVKTFAYVVGPEGKDETEVTPAKR